MPRKASELLLDGPGSVFAGVPDEELAPLLERGERLRLAPGTVVVAEGDRMQEVYIAFAGSADVVLTDRHGRERLVGRIEPGTSFGEMSLLTGDPAAATVRVTEELDVLIVSRQDFEHFAARFPVVYRNLAELLAERLARTNRMAVAETRGRITLLRDEGAPPLLAYALACSLAWHTRGRTLLVVLGDDSHDDLRALGPGVRRVVLEGDARPRTGRAELILARDEGPFAPGLLAGTLQELGTRFDDVLVSSSASLPLPAHRRLHLVGAQGARLAEADGEIPVRAWRPLTRRTRGPRGGVVDVPPLAPADTAALREGVLPSVTAAGRALGWLARDIGGLKVGLALGAGSLRGYAHFGVLLALERAGIEPDFLAGTSIGAAVASLSALGFSGDVGAAVFDRGARNVFRPALPVYALLSGRGVRQFVQSIAGRIRMEDLDVPIAIVAADLESRREIVFRRGLLWQAIVASMAIPGVYPAVRMGPWVLVDGGIIDPVPTGVCAAMGADVVIGVSLGSMPAEPVTEAEALITAGAPPNALAILLPSVEVMQARVEGVDSPVTTLMLSPEVRPLGLKSLRNFAQGRRFFADGERAAEEAIPRLAAVLPWLRGRKSG